MCLTLYVDDSGSDPNSPLYVLGGVCLPASWWTKVSNEWSGVLAADPSVEYFKASEVWDRKLDREKLTPFVKFTDEERRRKVDALVDVVTAYQPLTSSFQLEWPVFKEFRRKYALPKGKDDPYFYLYYGAILLQTRWGIRESNERPVSFVFDNQNSVGEEVKKWYPTFKDNCSPEVRARLGEDPKFKDEKETLPLQVSDLFAWYARRNATDSLAGEWHPTVWNRLSEYYSRGTLDMEDLVDIWNKVKDR
jgi:Protein of unknown function (DUF3800)